MENRPGAGYFPSATTAGIRFGRFAVGSFQRYTSFRVIYRDVRENFVDVLRAVGYVGEGGVVVEIVVDGTQATAGFEITSSKRAKNRTCRVFEKKKHPNELISHRRNNRR